MLTWDELSCVERNGALTGYRIEYGTTTFDNNKMLMGASNTTVIVTNLNPDTNYMFRVAGVNSNNIGIQSSVTQRTPPSGIEIYKWGTQYS